VAPIKIQRCRTCGDYVVESTLSTEVTEDGQNLLKVCQNCLEKFRKQISAAGTVLETTDQTGSKSRVVRSFKEQE
jgi:predicted nucleic acid-binding Zn ribbon protein